MKVMSNVSEDFALPDEVATAITDECCELLKEYDYNYTRSVVMDEIKESASNKGRVINILSKHPNWNPEKLQIQFSSDYVRAIDSEAIDRFFEWARRTYLKENAYKPDCSFDERELHNIVENLEKLTFKMSDIRNHCALGGNVISSIVIDGKSYAEIFNDLAHYREMYDNIYGDVVRCYVTGGEMLVTRDVDNNAKKLAKLNNLIIDYFNDNADVTNVHLCTEELANNINYLFPNSATKGKKISRILGKICSDLGLENVKEIREDLYNDNNTGELRIRKKDYGWNYQRAMMGDAINPFKIKRHTVISVNFIDFLTMSFGHNWASCHTIDVHNERGADNGYHGEYCAGTLSYAKDPSSIIFYTVDEKYNGTEFELQDKMQRAVFAIGGDKMYQGRVYPDGRDGGDLSLAAQFRNVMQKVIADCLDVPNLWMVKKGTTPCTDWLFNMGGFAYHDWNSCSDSSMSFLKVDDRINGEEYIKINAVPNCLCCGEELDTLRDLLCNSCGEIEECNCCGRRFNAENGIFTAGGTPFCCPECAEQEGYRWCFDDEEWHHEDNCYYDDYRGEFFHDTDEMVEVDDCCYHDSDNAERAGYQYCENIGEWHSEEDCYRDDYTGEYFYPTCDSVTIDEYCYSCEENAEADGWVLNDGGEWVRAEEDAV